MGVQGTLVVVWVSIVVAMATPLSRQQQQRARVVSSNNDVSACALDSLEPGSPCQFYSCMKQKSQCSTYFLHSLGSKFCHRGLLTKDQFSSTGQAWVERTNTCMVTKLAQHLSSSTENCAHIDPEMTQTFHSCAAEAGICDIIWQDREALLDTLTHKWWLSAVQAAHRCPQKIVNKFIFWALQNLNIY